jgi:hypothetical protein
VTDIEVEIRYCEGRKVLMNNPRHRGTMVTALNETVLQEYVPLADIVLATPETIFQDRPHFDFGIVPGDGVNLL